MKLADLEVGKTYWYSTREDWLKYPTRDWDRHPVRVDSLDRYHHSTYYGSRNPDENARKDPKGQYLRVIVPGDPESKVPSQRKDRVAYVRPRYIRGEAEIVLRQINENRERERAERKATGERNALVAARAEALTDRLAALGLHGARAYPANRGLYGPDQYVKVEVSEEAMAALVDRLERAEAGGSR